MTNIEGHPRIGHGGGIFGFTASLEEYPKDRITVSVVANTAGNDADAGKIADRIQRIVLGLPRKK